MVTHPEDEMAVPEASLNIKLASTIEACGEARWLIDELWADDAVGIVGGEPKCGKSFMALDMALAVASGKPCLRRFAVPRPGPVLLFSAEDSEGTVRTRLDGIAAAAGIAVDGLPIHVISEPVMLLDDDEHRDKLSRALDALRPRLLILDPYVRLQRSDENQAGSVAPILAFLRGLNRTFKVAIVVVHHARKGSGKMRAGQALRGSSDFHAWGDSNLYLRRIEKSITLSAEHRGAPSPDDLSLVLGKSAGGGVSLRLATDDEARPRVDGATARARVEEALLRAKGPMSIREIRSMCRVRTTKVCEALAKLAADGVVVRLAKGYVIRGGADGALNGSANGHGGGVAAGNGNGKPREMEAGAESG